jgi:hypothetical protein
VHHFGAGFSQEWRSTFFLLDLMIWASFAQAYVSHAGVMDPTKCLFLKSYFSKCMSCLRREIVNFRPEQ